MSQGPTEEGAEVPDAPPFIAFRGALDVDLLEVGEGLLLPIFEDERPLRGFAGLVDWRLHGQLSRLLKAGSLTGTLGERCLVPTQGYLRAERALIMGAGPRAKVDASILGGLMAKGVKALDGLGVRTIALPFAELIIEVWGVEEGAKICLSLIFGLGGERAPNLSILGGGEAVQSLRGAIEATAGTIIEGGALSLV